MASDFSPTSLPTAVAGLFKLNGYDVTGPIISYAGEVDLVARKETDLFPDPIYIEVTVQHVDNDKFAKDLTKLSPIQRNEPDAKVMIVSSAGFTAAVRTKAKETGITALTFTELEARFQHFDGYLSTVLGETAAGEALRSLMAVYEEPDFDDTSGTHVATEWLDAWLHDEESHRWLIVTGEYGTGKTALTNVLLHRWLEAYRSDSSLPIPFRIELRSFSRQFEARSLLHHFLDNNGLGHLPIEFVFSLIRTGRVVLLLDGYDEMAQYMNARERRACLEALAQLAAEGARGILTSRPNYFTEAEELQVLEALYTSLEQSGRLTREEASVIADEQEVDALFEQQIINRLERQLKDLTPEQTEQLVERKLVGDPEASALVVDLLRRIFRADEEGSDIALSGKPVIITYLLDIADQLRDDDTGVDRLSEWQVYDLIVRKLMIRDYNAAPETLPDRRRQFLRQLAIRLSGKDISSLSDEAFVEFVRDDFQTELRKVPAETREGTLQQYVSDLRRSATLTRDALGSASGFRFSHNSLREFLASEALLNQLNGNSLARFDVPVTQAMRTFVASRGPAATQGHAGRLAAIWPARAEDDGAGQLLALLWDALVAMDTADAFNETDHDAVRGALVAVAGASLDLSGVRLDGLDCSAAQPPSLQSANFARTTLSRVRLDGAELQRSSFDESVLDEVSFVAADLSGATFRGSALADTDFTAATLTGADFNPVDAQFEIKYGTARYEGPAALGLLQSLGATTAEVDPIHVLRHHAKFEIAIKVAATLADGAKHQIRGLTQRGAAQADPKFANRFLTLLVQAGVVSVITARQLVQVNDGGMRHLRPFAAVEQLTPEMAEAFRKATRTSA